MNRQAVRKIAASILVILSFISVEKVSTGLEIPLNILFLVLAVVITTGAFNYLKNIMKKEMEESQRSITDLKPRLLLAFILIISFHLARGNGWFWLSDIFLDPATFIFIVFLPFIFFAGFRKRTSTFFSIIMIFFSWLFSVRNYEKTTENLMIIAYFLLVTAVIQQLFDLYRSKDFESEYV